MTYRIHRWQIVQQPVKLKRQGAEEVTYKLADWPPAATNCAAANGRGGRAWFVAGIRRAAAPVCAAQGACE
jgi:hypothetical protein